MNFYGSNRTGNLPADPTGKSMSKRGGGRGDIIPKGFRKGQIQQFNPEQMELFNRLFSLVGSESDLARLAGGDETRFNEIEAPEARRFNELIGGLSSRFSSSGLGGRHSSGFKNTATAAASNFAQDLASRRHDLQRQAIMDLLGVSRELLGQRPSENFLSGKRQKEPGFFETFGQSFARSAGQTLGGGFFGGGGGDGDGGGQGSIGSQGNMASNLSQFLAYA